MTQLLIGPVRCTNPFSACKLPNQSRLPRHLLQKLGLSNLFVQGPQERVYVL
jgi:hypothetical protein